MICPFSNKLDSVNKKQSWWNVSQRMRLTDILDNELQPVI